jgi:hypothetical protein
VVVVVGVGVVVVVVAVVVVVGDGDGDGHQLVASPTEDFHGEAPRHGTLIGHKTSTTGTPH